MWRREPLAGALRSEEMYDGHVSSQHRLRARPGNVGRRAFSRRAFERVRLELVERAELCQEDPLSSDQSGLDLIELESLILAQNERWRQA